MCGSIRLISCVESRSVSCAPELRIVVNASQRLATHRLLFLNHDCATKRTYMEMKTRILLLGILSILYGLFVTDRKYPRTDKYGRISLNIHTAGTVNTEHGGAGGG